jgi:hypothetical protein
MAPNYLLRERDGIYDQEFSRGVERMGIREVRITPVGAQQFHTTITLHADTHDASAPGSLPPIGRPSPAMPAEHGIRLDDEERVAPCRKPSTDENPESAVAVTKPWAWHPALQHVQLLTQAQILGD